MVSNRLKEECIAENFQFLLHKNISSRLDLFLDRLNSNKKERGVHKDNFKRFISSYFFRQFSQEESVTLYRKETYNLDDGLSGFSRLNSRRSEKENDSVFTERH